MSITTSLLYFQHVLYKNACDKPVLTQNCVNSKNGRSSLYVKANGYDLTKLCVLTCQLFNISNFIAKLSQ